MASSLVQRLVHLAPETTNTFHSDLYCIPFLLLVIHLFHGYKNPDWRRPEREFEIACKGVAAGFLSITLINLQAWKTQLFSQYLSMIWFVLAIALVLVIRFSLRALSVRLYRGGVVRRKAVLLGSPEGFCGYQEKLNLQRHAADLLMGVILDSPQQEPALIGNACLPALGSIDQFDEILRRIRPDVVIAALSNVSREQELFDRLSARCAELKIPLELYSDVLAATALSYERNEFSGCVHFSPRPSWSITMQRLLKRGLDLILGLLGSAVTLLLTPVVGFLIKIEDAGPIFHRREFVGCNGGIRYYLKFRTMVQDADLILESDPELKAQFKEKYKLEGDPRVLRVGRFLRKYSIDEFPQFFSVLTGQLTFVGPRVISRAEKDRYGSLLPKLLSVKPGLTGFWQVTGRQLTSYEERVGMDMFYIDRWSVWLDLLIISKTFWKVLKAEGAH